MTPDAERIAYLAGESDGSELEDENRGAIDRLRFHLASEATWAGEGLDARSKLLAAAAAEPAPAPATLDLREEPASPDSRREARTEQHGQTGLPATQSRRARAKRLTRSSGVLLTAAAAAAAIGFVSAARFATPSDLPTVATYELAATPLDPNATGTIDIKPTAAGVEIELNVAGLDNTGQPDNGPGLGEGEYYAAWLMSDGDAVPLGSFSWRSGGVPVVLWSGVDDPAYDRFVITRQVEGDNGVRSDQVVLMSPVPSLTG